jgi:hypothetical protein
MYSLNIGFVGPYINTISIYFVEGYIIRVPFLILALELEIFIS